MLTEFLISYFIKNHSNVKNRKVRESYSKLSGILGIIINLILFTVELLLGMITNSIAMIADAFHDLADVSSSIISLIGFKLANKPADREHPFGHGRLEYISTLAISIIIILIGYEFLKSSFARILHPEQVNFSIISFIIILIAMPLKLWLGFFNKTLGKKINSTTITAVGTDALNDVAILLGVVLSLFISDFIHINVDGYIGAIVAIFIIVSGISLIKETIDPLLGQAPDPILVKELTEGVLNYKYVSGTHDLIIHNYGPGRSMASLHAEVPSDVSIMEIHEVIDRAEKELSKKLNMFIVIHMDPISKNSKEVSETKEFINSILENFPEVISFHDFRIVGKDETKNLLFDVVVNYELPFSQDAEAELKNRIYTSIKNFHPKYNAKITVDRDFS